jgi:hypothetical protein
MNIQDFIAAIMQASKDGKLEFVSCDNHHVSRDKVTLEIDNYGGARIDRLYDRNKITNALGFKRVLGTLFWSANEDDGCGSFLADIFVRYGKNYYFLVDGKLLPLVCDITTEGRGYTSLDPINADGALAALKALHPEIEDWTLLGDLDAMNADFKAGTK